MVPVEPISLTIGIASLFSTCVKCFDYFKAAQSLAENLKILLVKLDTEKTRLLIWGNAVGSLKVDDSERAPDLRDPAILSRTNLISNWRMLFPSITWQRL